MMIVKRHANRTKSKRGRGRGREEETEREGETVRDIYREEEIENVLALNLNSFIAEKWRPAQSLERPVTLKDSSVLLSPSLDMAPLLTPFVGSRHSGIQ